MKRYLALMLALLLCCSAESAELCCGFCFQKNPRQSVGKKGLPIAAGVCYNVGNSGASKGYRGL